MLGPVTAWDDAGDAIALKGPRHRAVLARLIVARGRVVPGHPPGRRPVGRSAAGGAVGAVRTFVAALRRALEPDRPPRTPARLLVTEGPGYALRAAPDAVDAWRFEQPSVRRGAAARGGARTAGRGAGLVARARVRRVRRRAVGPRRALPPGRAAAAARSSGGPRRGWRWASPPRRCPTWTRT